MPSALKPTPQRCWLKWSAIGPPLPPDELLLELEDELLDELDDELLLELDEELLDELDDELLELLELLALLDELDDELLELLELEELDSPVSGVFDPPQADMALHVINSVSNFRTSNSPNLVAFCFFMPLEPVYSGAILASHVDATPSKQGILSGKLA